MMVPLEEAAVLTLCSLPPICSATPVSFATTLSLSVPRRVSRRLVIISFMLWVPDAVPAPWASSEPKATALPFRTEFERTVTLPPAVTEEVPLTEALVSCTATSTAIKPPLVPCMSPFFAEALDTAVASAERRTLPPAVITLSPVTWT